MNTKKIMLIEDDPDIVWLTQLQLQQAGYQVHTNTDGNSGLAEFLNSGADLLLLDIDLPGLGGWEVYSQVRSISPVPIIMLTAYPLQQTDRPRQFGEQSEVCMGKPFTFMQLRAAIDAMLAPTPQAALALS